MNETGRADFALQGTSQLTRCLQYFLSVFLLTGCQFSNTPTPSKASLSLSLVPSTVTVAEGRTAIVFVQTNHTDCGTYTDADTRAKQICCTRTFATGKECIVEVYGFEHGTDVIKAYLNGYPDVSAELSVTVTHVRAVSLVLTADTTVLHVALGAVTIASEVFDDAYVPLHRSALQWFVSDTSVVASYGMPAQSCGNPYMRLYGIQPGTVTISASTDGVVSNQITVNVIP